jgi:anti-anti-sigma factor
MRVEIERKDDIGFLRLTGRFHTGADEEYLRAKSAEIREHNFDKLVADFREVPYLDSTGIGFIVGVYTSVTKNTRGRFVLVGVNQRVREVLDVTRLSRIIPIASDMEAALEAVRGTSGAASASI